MTHRWCETCEHCSGHEDRPEGWHCLRWPRKTGYRYVKKDTWTGATPYRRCSEINQHGDCPMWERKRDEQMELVK